VKVMIDDTRDETHVGCALDLIARNYFSGLEVLKSFQISTLYLDHDLHSYSECGTKEFTGYDLICYLESNPDRLPEKIICVSSNPVGRARIEQVIKKLYGG
jgi:hypothetical protein